jgi:hypothetical protein
MAYGCSTPECNYDFGDCDKCSDTCPRAWQGDGVCDAECFTPECDFDKKAEVPHDSHHSRSVYHSRLSCRLYSPYLSREVPFMLPCLLQCTTCII